MEEKDRNEKQKPFNERQNEAIQFLIRNKMVGVGETNKSKITVEGMAFTTKFDQRFPDISNKYVDFINSFSRLEGLLDESEIPAVFSALDEVVADFLIHSEETFQNSLNELNLSFKDPKDMAGELTPILTRKLLDSIIINSELNNVINNQEKKELALGKLTNVITALAQKVALELSKEHFNDAENKRVKFEKPEIETVHDYADLADAFGEELTNEFLAIESSLVMKFFNDVSFAKNTLKDGEELNKEVSEIFDKHLADFENNEQLMKLFEGNWVQFEIAKHHFFNELNEVVSKITGQPLEFRIDFE